MPIVTVKNKFQVVIPRAVRVELGINRGDLLEARVERGKLTYTRKAVIEPPPLNKVDQARYFKHLRAAAPEWLKELWAASKRAGLDKMTIREIDAEIAAARRSRSSGKRKRSAK
jgi:AbrB family looped-hinge helix DNA binding protein